MTGRTFTYQTRVPVTASTEAALAAYAELYGKAERSLFADLQAGKTAAELKTPYLEDFDITARQFNAIQINLEGKVKSIQSRQADRVNELERRIKRAEKVITSLEKKAEKAPLTAKDKNKIHQKKRRLAILMMKLEVLKEDLGNGKIRLCFGGRKRFRAQFNLEANGYQNREEWREEWQRARSSQFFVIGSKGETAGCQGCVATMLEDGTLTLRLRLPNALIKDHGRYVCLEGILLAYGQDVINAALVDNAERTRLQGQGMRCRFGEAYKAHGQSISYRFQRDGKGWRVFITTAMPKPETVTDKRLGAIGVDLNADHLALCETDRFGNPVKHWTVPLVTYGKSIDQARAMIGDAARDVVAYAAEVGKPLVLERLDFRDKKAELEAEGRRYNRMLSSLAYSTIHQMIDAAAFRRGVKLIRVNPAYSSLIGRVKFAVRYGLSVHHAAALVLARRFLGGSERLPRVGRIPIGQVSQLTLAVSVRNQPRHVWSTWRQIARAFRPAHVAQYRRERAPTLEGGSASAEKALQRLVSVLSGESPSRESLAALLG